VGALQPSTTVTVTTEIAMQLACNGQVISLVLPYQTFGLVSSQQMDTISYLIEKSHPDLHKKLDFNSSVSLKILPNIQVEKVSCLYHPLVNKDNEITWRGPAIPHANLEVSIHCGRETQVVLEEHPKNDFAASVSLFGENETQIDGSSFEILFLVDM
jgi:hypothetical protein